MLSRYNSTLNTNYVAIRERFECIRVYCILIHWLLLLHNHSISISTDIDIMLLFHNELPFLLVVEIYIDTHKYFGKKLN